MQFGFIHLDFLIIVKTYKWTWMIYDGDGVPYKNNRLNEILIWKQQIKTHNFLIFFGLNIM
jgi:hypothetical protein